METVVWFQMSKGDKPERTKFYGDPSDEQIDEEFEEKCGGVYKWWRESECDTSEADIY